MQETNKPGSKNLLATSTNPHLKFFLRYRFLVDLINSGPKQSYGHDCLGEEEAKMDFLAAHNAKWTAT